MSGDTSPETESQAAFQLDRLSRGSGRDAPGVMARWNSSPGWRGRSGKRPGGGSVCACAEPRLRPESNRGSWVCKAVVRNMILDILWEEN